MLTPQQPLREAKKRVAIRGGNPIPRYLQARNTCLPLLDVVAPPKDTGTFQHPSAGMTDVGESRMGTHIFRALPVLWAVSDPGSARVTAGVPRSTNKKGGRENRPPQDCFRVGVYGNRIIGARQKANRCPVGFSTLTWHVYLPGSNFFNGMANRMGIDPVFAFSPSLISTGSLSNALTLPR